MRPSLNKLEAKLLGRQFNSDLLRPLHRKRPHKDRQRDRFRLPTVEDYFDDLGGDQRLA
jgi:hypothetical protein